MANVCTIDGPFIEKWESVFDSSARDRTVYDKLVSRVKRDVEKYGYITRPTFIQLVNWKSARIRPIFENRDFKEYRAGIKKCLAADDDEKMAILDELHGVGAPVASTILHFTYPDRFPVIDFRTAETLYHFGYIESPRVSAKKYAIFRDAILRIREQCPQYSLRQIDMALFAFNKYCSDGD
jgi:hypothetical protein